MDLFIFGFAVLILGLWSLKKASGKSGFDTYLAPMFLAVVIVSFGVALVWIGPTGNARWSGCLDSNTFYRVSAVITNENISTHAVLEEADGDQKFFSLSDQQSPLIVGELYKINKAEVSAKVLVPIDTIYR